MKHAWTVLCQKSTIDKDTNTMSLVDVFEELTFNKEVPDKKVTGVPLSFELVSLWYDNLYEKESSGTLLVEVYDEQNKKLKEFTHEFVIPKQFKRMRTRVRVNGLPFSGLGDYTIRISYKHGTEKEYTEVTELPLELRAEKSVKEVLDQVGKRVS